MSGHSHAKTVMHKKMTDANKRGRIFSKIARVISIAAKDGGDPETNSKLRQAIEEAKRFNMPKDNVEKAIKRGTGELQGEILEEVTYEALCPNNMFLIIDAITDNKNRAMLEIKQILQKHNSKLANEGSIKWNFEKKGFINLRITNKYEYTNKDKEYIELKIIEAGAEDFKWREQEDEKFLEIITKPENLEKIKKEIEAAGTEIASSFLGWQAKEKIGLNEKEKQGLEKLFAELNESDSVQKIYSNLKV